METIKTLSTEPFRHFITTIGELPSSFTESMSYYELLAWLCNYLEKTVIPAVNENAAATKELQDLFVELKDYVDNYFDNLDIQTEVDNKLDEMADSGQLADIIAAYIQLKGVLAFDTPADIVSATNLVNGSFVMTYGYQRKGDGVTDLYKVRTITNVDVIDGYNLVSITAAPTLVAERLQKGRKVVIKMKATDDINDYLALECEKTIVLPEGVTYEVDDALCLNSNTTLDLNGSTLYFNYTRPASFPLIDWDETVGFVTFKNDSTFTGYSGYHDIVIKNGIVSDGCSAFMHTSNLEINNVKFVNLQSRHALQFAACKNVVVKNCEFVGTKTAAGNGASSECINIDPCSYGAQPYVAEDSAMYDYTPNLCMAIEGNTFKNATDAYHTYQSAIGAHGGVTYGSTEYTICENIVINNNNLGTPLYAAIIVRDFINATISNNTCVADAEHPAFFIEKKGFITSLHVHDNEATNVSSFLANGTKSLPMTGLNCCNNIVKCLDSGTDASAAFVMMNLKDSQISNNKIEYAHHAFHINSGDYFDNTSIGTDTYTSNVDISNNTLTKTLNDTVYFAAFRIAHSSSLKINGNTFIHLGTAYTNHQDLLIQTGTTNLYVTNNVTDLPDKFTAGENVTDKFNNNNAVYIQGEIVNSTSTTGTLKTNASNYKTLILNLGNLAHTQTLELKPFYNDGSVITNRTYTFTCLSTADVAGKGSFQISDGTDWTYSGTAPIRMVIALDH